MKKLITVLAMTIFVTASITVCAAVHTHVYGTWVYLSTSQDGSYQHRYINGYIQGTEIPTYGTCTVCSETEKWQLKCNTCSSRTNQYKYVSYDCHGACGLGDVQN